ncbi:MAG: hypothetical protein RIT14_1158 [Pseudomonadota bacterium]|jgi:hypothetical protein
MTDLVILFVPLTAAMLAFAAYLHRSSARIDRMQADKVPEAQDSTIDPQEMLEVYAVTNTFGSGLDLFASSSNPARSAAAKLLAQKPLSQSAEALGLSQPKPGGKAKKST